jgi:hypothetical protein
MRARRTHRAWLPSGSPRGGVCSIHMGQFIGKSCETMSTCWTAEYTHDSIPWCALPQLRFFQHGEARRRWRRLAGLPLDGPASPIFVPPKATDPRCRDTQRGNSRTTHGLMGRVASRKFYVDEFGNFHLSNGTLLPDPYP